MRTPFFIIFLIIALALAAFVGALAYFTFNPPSATKGLSPEREGLSPDQQSSTLPSRPVISSSDPVRGDPNAELAIVEFGDFFCPACGEVEDVLNKVLEQYKERVKLVWKDMPNTARHPLAQKSAEAARCAGVQGKFWQYHDELFANQEKLSENYFAELAGELGLNANQFSQCLAEGAMIETVRRTFNEGLLLKVDATPFFFIGEKRISGAISEEGFINALGL